MAFDKTKLVKVSSHANADEGQLYSYKEDETVANISASGYMNDVADVLRKGDVVTVFGSNGTANRQVTSDTGATPVTLGALTA